jgi:hypothetical protein
MTQPNSQCFRCKHFNTVPDDNNLYPNCKAWPERIPIEVFTNEVMHDKPLVGDQGIQFEPIE